MLVYGWHAGVEDVPASKDQLRILHKTISKVTDDTEELRFNTAIAAMMEFMNDTKRWTNKPREALEPLLLLLAPYAPHIAEECWSRCGHESSLAYAPWPQVDASLLEEDEITLPVQVRTPVAASCHSLLVSHLHALVLSERNESCFQRRCAMEFWLRTSQECKNEHEVELTCLK